MVNCILIRFMSIKYWQTAKRMGVKNGRLMAKREWKDQNSGPSLSNSWDVTSANSENRLYFDHLTLDLSKVTEFVDCRFPLWKSRFISPLFVYGPNDRRNVADTFWRRKYKFLNSNLKHFFLQKKISFIFREHEVRMNTKSRH